MGVVGALHVPEAVTPAAGQAGPTEVFADEFDDGAFAWSDVDHPEFWTESDGRVRYSPSSSAGSVGDNYAYADETVDGDEGVLEWPVAIEFRAHASDTSASLGVHAAAGGPRDGVDSRLGISDNAYKNRFHVTNSEGEQFDLRPARENDTWYTYRLVPEPQKDVVRIERNDESWTVPEPNDEPMGDISIVLDGGTCWGCGGNGDRTYEYVRVRSLQPGDQCEAAAEISAFSVEGGTFEVGETVEAAVTVRNTGGCSHEYFVGFGVTDADGNAYDNDGSTGHSLRVPAGEAETTTVSWRVEEDASPGRYDAGAAVWRESDRASLETRLAEATRQRAFRVSGGSTGSEVLSGTVVDAADSPVADATVRVFGRDGPRQLGETTTDERGEFAFDQWTRGDVERFRDEFSSVVVLAGDGVWFDSRHQSAGAFFDQSSPVRMTLQNRYLRQPTVIRDAEGAALGQVSVWHRLLDDGEGVLSVELANTNDDGDASDIENDVFDLSSGIFSVRVPEDEIAVEYGPADDVDVGGRGLNASSLLMAPTAEADVLVPFHPARTGLPLHAGATHLGVYELREVSNDDSVVEEGVSRVIGTIPGISTFANWANNLEWVFGDPFERTAEFGAEPERADPNRTDDVLGPWSSDSGGTSQEATVVFSVPFERLGQSPVDVTVVADWKFDTTTGFGEGHGSFAESYTLRPR